MNGVDWVHVEGMGVGGLQRERGVDCVDGVDVEARVMRRECEPVCFCSGRMQGMPVCFC